MSHYPPKKDRRERDNAKHSHYLLTADEAARADQLTIAGGRSSFYQLMFNAGHAVAEQCRNAFPKARKVAVLCGPGNNGGDGYVAAKALREAGLEIVCFADRYPSADSDAAKARGWQGEIKPFNAFVPQHFDVAIDALYGVGLNRPLGGSDSELIARLNGAPMPVVSVDLPSGIYGDNGRILGSAIQATVTVTFFCRKPGHLLFPGKALCGRTACVDIGIDAWVLEKIVPKAHANHPIVWLPVWPQLRHDAYKYSRGAVAVFSGPPEMTGAARLTAKAAARAGAGAVTLLSSPQALPVNASHLTSIMLRPYDNEAEALAILASLRAGCVVLGPGFSDKPRARFLSLMLLALEDLPALLLDADALSAFEAEPQHLFEAAERSSTSLVLTPHEGEFARLFPDIADNNTLSRLERARIAAARAHATLILKGPDTIIANPQGVAVINDETTPLLATAGSGDVLAGICAGLMAQKMPAFEAAAAAVYLHSQAALHFGAGLIAEDLIETLPQILREINACNGG